MRYLALVHRCVLPFAWAYGGYYASDIAVGPGNDGCFSWDWDLHPLFTPTRLPPVGRGPQALKQMTWRGPVSVEVISDDVES